MKMIVFRFIKKFLLMVLVDDKKYAVLLEIMTSHDRGVFIFLMECNYNLQIEGKLNC